MSLSLSPESVVGALNSNLVIIVSIERSLNLKYLLPLDPGVGLNPTEAIKSSSVLSAEQVILMAPLLDMSV